MLHLLALLGHGYIALITALFFVGLVGSAVVLLMTFWEDLLTLAGKGEPDAREVRHAANSHQARPGKAIA